MHLCYVDESGDAEPLRSSLPDSPPVFVLVDKGRELGRIRGYPGEDHFWCLFDALVERTLGKPPAAGPAAQEPEKPLRIKG